MRTVNCKVYGYKGKLVIGDDGEYKGLVYTQRDPGQGRTWKSIIAEPYSTYRLVLHSCVSIEEAVKYVAGDE